MNERVARLRGQIAADRRALDRRLEEAAAADLSAGSATDEAYHFAWASHHAYSADLDRFDEFLASLAG